MHPQIEHATWMTMDADLSGISGGATTFSTEAFDYMIGGKTYTNAAVSGGTTPTTDAVTGDAITLTASQGRIVVWCVNADGDEKVIAGPVASLDEDTDDFLEGKAPQFPNIDFGTYCPFAYTIMRADDTLSGTFTFGSSNWNTSGMAFEVVDIGILPHRPQQ